MNSLSLGARDGLFAVESLQGIGLLAINSLIGSFATRNYDNSCYIAVFWPACSSLTLNQETLKP